MNDNSKNLYQILEVNNDASFEDIKKSYKKLARIYHPDINKSKSAEVTFKLLNSAYGILSNEWKRKRYDEFLKEEEEKLFTDFPDNNSVIKEIKITENERKSGTIRTVNILNTQKCPKCMGRKFINGFRCAFCKGIGEKKDLKQIEVVIKPDTQEGDLIPVGKINKSEVFDKKLFLKISIEEAHKMRFEGNNIIYDIEIPVYDAVLGCKKEINTDKLGTITVEIPPNIQNKERIKINTKKCSTCYAEISIVLPDKVSDEEKYLYDKIRKIHIGR